jgi:hypothetical protein
VRRALSHAQPRHIRQSRAMAKDALALYAKLVATIPGVERKPKTKK